ncbi:MAG: hypothetical protein ABIA63_05690 [bacterium]
MEYDSKWPVLDRFSMLLVNNNRSKAYLQNLIGAGHLPDNVILLDSGRIILPEQTENDMNLFSKTQQKLIRDCPETGIAFDEKEHIQKTAEKNGINLLKIDNLDVNSPEVIGAVKEVSGAYVVYSGPGGAILRKEILSLGKWFLHVHSGWLPDFKGSTTPYYSLLADGGTACSVIALVEEIDTGPVFLREKFYPNPGTDLDYIFDPSSRAASLINFFKQNRGKIPVEIKVSEKEKEGGNLYFIIHPVLKHLSILSMGNKS